MSDMQEQLQSVIAYPREELDIEIKGWLDLNDNEGKANLAKALMAIANHGGGHVLIGFTEANEKWVPDAPRPPDLSGYSQDTINGIVKRYADPPFHCKVDHMPHPDTEQVYPVISVPGGHIAPIRAKRGGPNDNHLRKDAYYIRRPGPASESPQTAAEWNQLMMRCVRNSRVDLLDGIRDLLSGVPRAREPVAEEQNALQDWISAAKARWLNLVETKLKDEQPLRYEHGVWYFAYSLEGEFNELPCPDLLEVLKKAQRPETGWPEWWVPGYDELKPYPVDGLVECWLSEGRSTDGAHSDFWRASPEGRLFLLRGYREDSVPHEYAPGTVLDRALPIWRVAECLMHAEALAALLADSPLTLHFRFAWEGLEGRSLVAVSDRFVRQRKQAKCRQSAVQSSLDVTSDRVSERLPELVKHVTAPLFEAFDFTKMPIEVIRRELEKMRKHSTWLL